MESHKGRGSSYSWWLGHHKLQDDSSKGGKDSVPISIANFMQMLRKQRMSITSICLLPKKSLMPCFSTTYPNKHPSLLGILQKHSPSNIELSLTPNNSVVSRLSKPLGEIHSHRQKLFHRQNLVLSMSSAKNPPEAERQQSLIINSFITANKLPFHLSECPILDMLVLARNTNNSYKPPRRTEMSEALLDANCTAYQSSSLQRLLTNANIFGLGIYGDGTAIGNIHMMNILAASAGNPNGVIDIID